MDKIATMKVWNVDRGLSVHIKAPNGKYIVIDLGSRKDVSPLETLSDKEVEYMVITHPHYDHFCDIGNIRYGYPKVLWRVKSFSKDELMKCYKTGEEETFEKYCNFIDRFCQTVSANRQPSLGTSLDGLTAKVFHASPCDKSKINNSSGIVVLKLGNVKVVVCGDNEKESFEILMKQGPFQDAVKGSCVLVAAHHGRESGFYEDFVSLVKPYITIISDTSASTTSVTDKYDKLTKGYSVYNNQCRTKEFRKCLTTRNDGNIKVNFGETDDKRYQSYLDVSINCIF